MSHREPFLVMFSATMFLVSACAGTTDEAHEEMVEEEVTSESPSETSSQDFQLGGGNATELHPGNNGSPHVRVTWDVDDANISITYGRPYLNDRVVGETVEPTSDRFWRLGADEATTLSTDTDIMLGGSHIPSGEYTLFTQWMNDEFHLIVNSETGQWGLSYNPDNDVAHVPMEVTTLDPPAEQLTLAIQDGQLGFEWGQMAASVPLMTH